MCCRLADFVSNGVEDHLTDDEDEDAKGDVDEWPAVLEGICDEDDLHDDVDKEAQGVEEIKDHEETERVERSEPTFVFESKDADAAAEDEHPDGCAAEEPNGHSGAVFVELEADKAIDEEGCA